jgi:hypothetical protein
LAIQTDATVAEEQVFVKAAHAAQAASAFKKKLSIHTVQT